MPDNRAQADIEVLHRLVIRLRSPDGCPWDREQELPDLRAYLLEEAHEVAAAIDAGEWDELQGELGDLLFQTVFISRLAEERGAFSLGDVIEHVRRKMIDRHPHVFERSQDTTAEGVRRAWETRKLREKRGQASLLAGVPPSLPALLAAFRMGEKAAGVGFDWSEPPQVLEKVEEEMSELRDAMAQEKGRRREALLREEIGDLLFTVANLARHLSIDPEAALAAANLKFRRRFASLEQSLASRGKNLAGASLEEMEEIWEASKRPRGDESV